MKKHVEFRLKEPIYLLFVPVGVMANSPVDSQITCISYMRKFIGRLYLTIILINLLQIYMKKMHECWISEMIIIGHLKRFPFWIVEFFHARWMPYKVLKEIGLNTYELDTPYR